MTLVEIMVVLAIIAVIALVGVPALSSILSLQQHAAAEELAKTYRWLQDEAALRNVTFRVAFDLDQGSYTIQVGDPATLVFSTPDAREQFESELKSDMKRFTQRELEEGAADELTDKAGRFESLPDSRFGKPRLLPPSCRFAYVYTPQYGEGGKLPSEDPPEDPADDAIAYTYIFPDGSSEHVVIRIVDADDAEDGYTVEVEPLSGKVTLTEDTVDPEASLSWVPQEGPKIQ